MALDLNSLPLDQSQIAQLAQLMDKIVQMKLDVVPDQCTEADQLMRIACKQAMGDPAWEFNPFGSTVLVMRTTASLPGPS